MSDKEDCLSCKAILGDKPISPGRRIYDSNLWVIEHASSVELLGWLIILPKRHVEALDQLTMQEWQEYAVILPLATQLLKEFMHCQKEYVLCLAEKDGFKHVHFHVIAIPESLAKEKRGANVFKCLAPADQQLIVAKEDIITFCQVAYLWICGKLKAL